MDTMAISSHNVIGACELLNCHKIKTWSLDMMLLQGRLLVLRRKLRRYLDILRGNYSVLELVCWVQGTGGLVGVVILTRRPLVVIYMHRTLLCKAGLLTTCNNTQNQFKKSITKQ